jgi:plasmid rolling circle replication initiator protein Rep
MLRTHYAAKAAVTQECNESQYLTDYSPGDKPWDTHRGQAQTVEGIYSGTIFNRLAARISRCTGYLGFAWEDDSETGESRLKLRAARFCRVRHCPVCQWRRSLMWQARFLKALPAIEAAYPNARWLFLTLTVRNVPISELRSQIRSMNEAWNRFVQRREFGAVQGWIRTTEVTRADNDYAHPHFHVLLMVRPSYFSSKYYVTQSRWTELWRECARLDYTPIIDVRTVRAKLTATASPLRAAISETLKYAVKPEDMVHSDWLIALTSQVHKLRFIASGGVLKNVLREDDESEQDLLLAEDGEGGEPVLFFDWRRAIKRYVKRSGQ